MKLVCQFENCDTQEAPTVKCNKCLKLICDFHEFQDYCTNCAVEVKQAKLCDFNNCDKLVKYSEANCYFHEEQRKRKEHLCTCDFCSYMKAKGARY